MWDKCPPYPGPWFSNLHNEEQLWQQWGRAGSTLSSPTSSAPLAFLPAWGYKWRATLRAGMQSVPGGAPQSCTLRERPAPGSRQLLYIHIYSPRKPNPACTCSGLQAPCPCPGWAYGLFPWAGTGCIAGWDWGWWWCHRARG